MVGAGVGWAASAGLARRALARVRAAERRARSAERMAEIGAMTGGLAHEIKNPLSTIGLNAQLLAEAIEGCAADDAERSRMLARVGALRREAERLREILSDFLEFAGQMRLDKRPTDLNALVTDLVDFFTPEAQRHAVRLRAELAPGGLTASVDPRLIKQALLNLMLNATQAMDASPAGPGAGGRELILRTLGAREPDGTETARIEVIDTGPGVSEEIRDRIFTPYFTTKSGGSGLGLPTTRRIAEEHAGRVELHTEPGKGSSFAIVVPR
jgi:signal transduction histidine kinase